LKKLQEWLESYKSKELFKENGDVIDKIKMIIPTNPDRRLGQKEEVSGAYRGLKAIDWRKFTVEKGTAESSMKAVGRLLEQIVKDNPKTFRIFSPDEFESNKLDAVLNFTNRNFQCDQFS
jgi:xylulose-5-phosphate/fructose-6-phosphate phosphoketolase